MTFYISCVSDVGIKKQVNQDSVFVEQYATKIGKVVLAVLCDGMGGLRYGEFASNCIVSTFSEWGRSALPALCVSPIRDCDIRWEWTELIRSLNQKIRDTGLQGGFKIGSTVTALLISEDRYFILNIGDSRAYEIRDAVRQLTTDHTVIENEIRLGNMTPEQAEASPIKSVLTKCVGVAPSVCPDLYFGTPTKGAVYMLCSDGFRHHISQDEMKRYLLPARDEDIDCLQNNAEFLVELNKKRGESDNISVISVFVK